MKKGSSATIMTSDWKGTGKKDNMDRKKNTAILVVSQSFYYSSSKWQFELNVANWGGFKTDHSSIKP